MLCECDAWGQTHQAKVFGSCWRQSSCLRLTAYMEVSLGAWTWHTLDVGNKGRRKEQSWKRGRDNCLGIAVLDTVWAVLLGLRGEEYSLAEQMKWHSPKRLMENQQGDGTSSQKILENSELKFSRKAPIPQELETPKARRQKETMICTYVGTRPRLWFSIYPYSCVRGWISI